MASRIAEISANMSDACNNFQVLKSTLFDSFAPKTQPQYEVSLLWRRKLFHQKLISSSFLTIIGEHQMSQTVSVNLFLLRGVKFSRVRAKHCSCSKLPWYHIWYYSCVFVLYYSCVFVFLVMVMNTHAVFCFVFWQSK